MVTINQLDDERNVNEIIMEEDMKYIETSPVQPDQEMMLRSELSYSEQQSVEQSDDEVLHETPGQITIVD